MDALNSVTQDEFKSTSPLRRFLTEFLTSLIISP